MMYVPMFRLVATILLTLLLVFSPYTTQAGEVSISPLLIDVEADARDILAKDITLTNETTAKKNIYVTVNEVAVDTTGEVKEFISPSMDDRTTAITSWLEITRGRVELEPEETEVIPLTIRINPQAKPGVYQAFIGFVQASNRPEAESVALRGDADGVIVKVNLEQKTSDLISINSFLVDRFVFDKTKQPITVELENRGDSDVTPSGEIIFYNSRGEEVGSVPVGNQAETIAPGASKKISVEIPLDDTLGRFKANIRLAYGKDQESLVFDTTQFFVIPLPLAIGAIVTILLLSVLLTYLLRRAFYDELHDEYASTLPLFVRNDREHIEKDHDIDLKT
jgi:hypothetical protein